MPEISWKETFFVYTNPKVIAMAFLGFAGGLPFLLVFSTLTVWLRDTEVTRGTIGFFAWIGITYSVKVLWAPIVDSVAIKGVTSWLGQRRSWILCGQLGIATGLLGMALVGTGNLLLLSLCALLVAFSSATQDVAIDAFRIESATPEYQGAMSASYVLGYRVALLVAGAGALYAAEFFSWQFAYCLMALLMLVGVITVTLVKEPERQTAVLYEVPGEVPAQISMPTKVRHWFVASVMGPFVDFFARNGRLALVILLFISVFRLSDIAMGIMANPFYLDMGYTKTDIANVAKLFGFFMTIAGSFLCGILVVKWGVMRPLLIGAILVAATNLLFSLLSTLPAELRFLAVVISADNIAGGFAATAFIAYLSSLTNRAYTATQYALFSSLMTLPGKFISGFSGLVVEHYDYFDFFIVAALMGIPAILLVLFLSRQESHKITPAIHTASD